MIVWAGFYCDFDEGCYFTDTGGRYDPATDSWTPTSRVNAPSARREHTAVWTGSEMIVWGGERAGVVLVVTATPAGATIRPPIVGRPPTR